MNPKAPLDLKVVHRLFSDLTEAQRKLVRSRIGAIPEGHDKQDHEHLWKLYKSDQVGLFVLFTDEQDGAGDRPLEAGPRLAAFCFFKIEILQDASRDCYFFAALGIEPHLNLTMNAIPQMEQIAKAAGCSSVSLRTARTGLAVELVEKSGWFAETVTLRKAL